MVKLAIVKNDHAFCDKLKEYCIAEKEVFKKVVSIEHSEEIFMNGEAFDGYVFLIDIDTSYERYIDLVYRLKHVWSSCEILTLTTHCNTEKNINIIRAGAIGCIDKNAPLSDIKDAMKILKQGGAPISPLVARKLIDYFHPHNFLVENLTAREQEVVRGIIDGLSYKMIATRLDVSIDTVRKYIRKIYGKLKINSKAELFVKYSQEHPHSVSSN